MRRIIVAFLLAWPVSASAERFEFVSYVDQEIPDSDSAGVRDAIRIDQHIVIEDINIFVGIGTQQTPWAEEVLIDIFSPARLRVRLNDWYGERRHWYNLWYDTDREEDGPGQLEDYAGQDAFGEWEMFCFDPFEDYTLFWYSWRIEVIGTPLVDVDEKPSALPKDYEFTAIHPNPFNAEATFKYELPLASDVRFAIFDIQGRKVRTIHCGIVEAGYHQATWDGSDGHGKAASSGVYLVRMMAGDHQFTRKAILLK